MDGWMAGSGRHFGGGLAAAVAQPVATIPTSNIVYIVYSERGVRDLCGGLAAAVAQPVFFLLLYLPAI